MDIRIEPAHLRGRLTPPPSKSQAHRAVLACALAGGGTIENLAKSQDLDATRRCAAALRDGTDGLPLLDCGESGSTLRFMIPIALALRGGGRFTGHGRLMERPQKPYFDLFDEKGVSYGTRDGVLTVRGVLPPGAYRLPGDVSSQFVTGLLYALPLLDGDSEIIMTTPLESRDYVVMTLDMLKNFGIYAENQGFLRFAVPGGQRYRPRNVTIEADWSQAAFWYAAKALGHEVELDGLNSASAQGDRVVLDCRRTLTAPGTVEIDVSGCPDLLPPLAAMAALRRGTVRFRGAARLRLKESDRLRTVREELEKFGVPAEEGPDSLTVYGAPSLRAAALDAHNDHRIAMMDAVLATRAGGPCTLRGAESVAKSYPGFWDDYAALGGVFQEI